MSVSYVTPEKNGTCKTCIFYKLCISVKLDHCEYADYFRETKEEN